MERSAITGQRRLTRRHVLGAAASTVLVTRLTGGGRLLAQESTPLAQLNEAPMLAEQVATGALPPVAERLPTNPLIVQPHDTIGVHGGTWRTALVGGGDTAWLTRTVGYDYLLRWDQTWDEAIPNIAESWEVNADATRYTFRLRPGMRWSDGEPFTSADIAFYVNDVYRNAELTSTTGANPRTIEVVDDVTFTLISEEPDGLFAFTLAGPTGGPWTRYPRHYLSQFHMAYNTDTLDTLIEEAGAADWVELFRLRGGGIPGTPYDALWQNPDLPTLLPWIVVEPYGDTERMTMSRNPYYWKVDPQGNQLPYLDTVNFDVLQDAEVLLLKATSGEIDLHARHINTNANKPVLAESAESAGYRLFSTVRGDMNDVMISLNLTHKDAGLREVLANRDFRAGLSHAINRQEIIDTVYVSQGEAWQGAPRAETPFFNETLARQFTDFDIEQANALLNAVVPERDGDGMRLRPDGQPLVILVDVATGSVSSPVDQMNLVVGYWQQVGVNAQLNPVDRTLLYTRKDANDHDCAVWLGNGGLRFGALMDPRWYFPFNTESNYAIPWAIWFQNLANPQAAAEEPPARVREQMTLYRTLQATPDPEEQNRLFADVLAIAQEEFYAIGIVLPGPGYGIVSNRFRNVPDEMPEEWIYPTPAPTNPEQYWIDAGV